MNQAKYIGMDVHQATISVAALDSAGKLILESVLATKAATILQFIGGLPSSFIEPSISPEIGGLLLVASYSRNCYPLKLKRATYGANRTIRNFGPQRGTHARSRPSHHHSMVRLVRHHLGFLHLLRLVLGHLLAHDHRARHLLDARAPADPIRRHPRRDHLHVSDLLHHVLA